MSFEFPIWLLWAVSVFGLCLMVYVLIQWRKSWEACRPMPFDSRRRRYARGLLLALSLMIIPHFVGIDDACVLSASEPCQPTMYAEL